MSNVLAIDIDESEILLIGAECTLEEPVRLLDVSHIPLEALEVDGGGEDEDGEDDDLEETEAKGDSAVSPGDIFLPSLISSRYNTTAGVISRSDILYCNLDFPFGDAKKIENVAPLQIQDSLPFDLDEYLLDTLVPRKMSSSDYSVISTLVPKASISSTLMTLSKLGADPRVLSSRASALTGITILNPQEFQGDFGLMAISDGLCALSLFADGRVDLLREIPLPSLESSDRALGIVASAVSCSLESFARSHSGGIERLYLIGPMALCAQIRCLLDVPLSRIDISKLVNATEKQIQLIENHSWILGLIASEANAGVSKTKSLVNFRKGQFAYHAALANFMSVVKDELFYVVVAVLSFALWLYSSFYVASSSLAKVESAMADGLRRALPGESVPFRREVNYLEGKIAEAQAQLMEMGTLSSLSPLDTVREFARILDRQIDLQIDNINIAHNRLSIAGSVADYPAVGRLSKSLERAKQKFCSIKVDPQGMTGGKSSRVKFTAEIMLCQ